MSDEELSAKVAELTERVGTLSGVLLMLLGEREKDATLKAGTYFKRQRPKTVDAIGALVRPWLMIATPSNAKAIRALPLEEVVRDIATVCDCGDAGPAMANAVRESSVTWEDIGVDADGRVDANSLAKSAFRQS